MSNELVQMFVNAGRLNDALGEAARYGHTSLIEDLIKSGVKPTAKNSHGTPIINLAASGGSVSAIVLLLTHGADPNQTDNDGENSLFSCLWAKHDYATYKKCCKALILGGASIESANCDGLSVIELAAKRGLSLSSLI